jgi:glycosyltransferase involved in cell wall biosynthesis
MLCGKKLVVVMPAYNAQVTLERTLREIDRSLVDQVILVDDASQDGTCDLARRLQLEVHRHPENLGYGGNQKTCYRLALEAGADIVVMLHPDYQYSPKLIGVAANLIASGHYDIALGSRILGGRAREGGMPLYKYVSNRFLTAVQNFLTGMKLSEFHTGYRAFSRGVLESLPLEENDDDFLFDNQLLIQAHWAGLRIGEFTCPARYFPEASSIGLKRSLVYGMGCLKVSIQYLIAKTGLFQARIFRHRPRTESPRKLEAA